MGFKTSEWAYALDLPLTTKAVLLALAHRADDQTRACFPGQDALAQMTGASRRSVVRALQDLERLGLLRRESRRRASGSKTSDRCVLLVDSYVPDGHVTESHMTDGHVTESPASCDTQSDLTCHSVTYIEEEQSEEQPEEQSVDVQPADDVQSDFDVWWKNYPRKQARADALKAYRQARKTTSAQELLDGLQRYVLSTIGVGKEHIKLAGGWLRAERWTDEAVPITPDRDRGYKPTRGEENLAVIARYAAQERAEAQRLNRDEQNFALVAQLAAEASERAQLGALSDCGPGGHLWTVDGSCANCLARRDIDIPVGNDY